VDYIYTPSILLSQGELLRERSFTRLMSRDLMQPATDFLRHLNLVAIYAECSASGTRYLLWHPPAKCAFEIRSGRTRDQFEDLDRANIERGWQLLSLDIDQAEIHSAVWISTEHFETATQVLAAYGILPARRIPRS
jgi:hypothetical protein